MRQLTRNLSGRKYIWAYRVLFFSHTVFLFISTLIPARFLRGNGSGWLSFLSFNHSDKLIHYLLFFVMTALLFLSYDSMKKILYIIIPFSVGLLIEILQYTMAAGRTFDLLDLTANTLGVLTAFIFISRRP